MPRAFLLLALALALTACQPSLPVAGGRIVAEPPAAAQFIRAFAAGDEAVADGVASPLYRYEWARRAISIEQRLAVVPHRWHRTAADPEWIRFRYEGGVRDEAGFGHLFYTAWPFEWASPNPSPSVWRVDVDPENRVIWCELVWLFSDGTTDVRPADRLPPGVPAGTVRFGLLSTASPEGFYAVETNAQALIFLATGAEGKTRVAAWSYDSNHGLGRRAAQPALEADVAALHRSYVFTL
jgi:hypothetical protein